MRVDPETPAGARALLLPPGQRVAVIDGTRQGGWIIASRPCRVLSLSTTARTGLRLYDAVDLVEANSATPIFDLGATVGHHSAGDSTVTTRGLVAFLEAGVVASIRYAGG